MSEVRWQVWWRCLRIAAPARHLETRRQQRGDDTLRKRRAGGGVYIAVSCDAERKVERFGHCFVSAISSDLDLR